MVNSRDGGRLGIGVTCGSGDDHEASDGKADSKLHCVIFLSELKVGK